ncbi:MAG: (d)CMP kinase [Rhodospirillaceae bacterium]|jgi:CMP/dCMP kinase|nr:(d)CMP kinase [Rhodospirillaceae bacterium]MBT5565757.1 (d)CMP kinase [Rhodospirillaceae bacterium]MBT6088516.1 (d)CMP kinase [Rhodospirillaceae bacterium]MBT6959715.1 (d)CMP kinase [Rhodospirillaceae bacterium]
MTDSANLVVAIDGPAASGKGTLARRLAEILSLRYLDTGSLYRATGLSVLRAGGDLESEQDAAKAAETLDLSTFTAEDLRSEEAGVAASHVAFLPSVRAVLLGFQRSVAANPGGEFKGAILDGRDIGTVVCPDAATKIFVTATLEVRIKRRLQELKGRGEPVIEARVRDDMTARDQRDRDRSVSPLKPAEDAWELDTSDMNADEALAAALDRIRGTGPL